MIVIPRIEKLKTAKLPTNRFRILHVCGVRIFKKSQRPQPRSSRRWIPGAVIVVIDTAYLRSRVSYIPTQLATTARDMRTGARGKNRALHLWKRTRLGLPDGAVVSAQTFMFVFAHLRDCTDIAAVPVAVGSFVPMSTVVVSFSFVGRTVRGVGDNSHGSAHLSRTNRIQFKASKWGSASSERKNECEK